VKIRALFVIVLVMAGAFGTTSPSGAGSDARVTVDDHEGAYTRYDGTSDETMERCSEGRRQQNEPSIAVDPSSPNVVVAGSNDYCASIVNGDLWAGYYRSTDGGTEWTNSLVPGYPQDTSEAGEASPTHGVCSAAGDPTQSFDNDGRLFYGFICFNRVQPGNGSIYVATYHNHGADYVRTVRVARGTPSTWGLFQDKINLTVDQSGGPNDGNVYVAWARYPGQSSNNVIYVSRSTDHGQTFSPGIRVTQGLGEEQFADLAVGPNGNVYLTFRTFDVQGPTQNAVWLARSTDGAVSWSKPRKVSDIVPFDSVDYGPDSCGDGPFLCENGFTYSRWSSLSAVTADDDGVHVVWTARLPSGQAKIFIRHSPNGLSWPDEPATLDEVATGHQWFPDVASAEGVISVVFQDSRADPAYAPDVPPGNDASGTNSGDVVHAFVYQSDDGGETWSQVMASSAGSNLNWETHSSRRLGFWGDYNYISAVPGAVNAAWVDSRDLVPGDDPRGTAKDHSPDTFDVYQPCVYVPNDINAPTYESPTVDDPCLDQGGLDQNIYAIRL
jgi:hypothetical protein